MQKQQSPLGPQLLRLFGVMLPLAPGDAVARSRAAIEDSCTQGDVPIMRAMTMRDPLLLQLSMPMVMLVCLLLILLLRVLLSSSLASLLLLSSTPGVVVAALVPLAAVAPCY